MLAHLRMDETTEWRETGGQCEVLSYTDPDDPANWIEDPCSFCGGESVPEQVPPVTGGGTGHGAIHPPEDAGVSGYWYLCSSPDCQALAEAAWASFREAKA